MSKKEELLIALAKELDDWADISQFLNPLADTQEIGRASCRERV